MGMKGHKRGCKCVGCSAATRRKGMKAAGIGKKKATRKNPSSRSSTTRKKATTTRSSTTRKNASTRKAAPKKASPRKAAPKKATTRKAAPKTASPRKNPAPPCRCPRLPASTAGNYIVLLARAGKLQPLKVFTRLRDAEDYLKTLRSPEGAKAVLTEVRSTWG